MIARWQAYKQTLRRTRFCFPDPTTHSLHFQFKLYDQPELCDILRLSHSSIMNYQGGMQQSGSGEGWLASIRNRGKRHYSTSAYLLPFLFVRALQMAVLIVIVGLTSNWIATFGNSGLRIPENIIILLGFVRIAPNTTIALANRL